MDSRLMSAREAVKLIKPGDVIACSAFINGTLADEIYAEIERSYLETQTPNNLTIYSGSAMGVPAYAHSGYAYLAHEGLLKRVVLGHFGSGDQLRNLVADEKLEAYNIPQGVIAHMYRGVTEGKTGVLTKIGKGTFMDPNLFGGKVNDSAEEDLVEQVSFMGEDFLYYKAPNFDIAIIRGTTADELGNVSLEEEAQLSNVRNIATAVKRCGGKVIVQVKNYVAAGSIPAKQVVVPGIFVDAVVVTTNASKYHRQTFGSLYNPAFAGQYKVAYQNLQPFPLDERKMIGRRAAMEMPPNAIVNIGTGIPEAVSSTLTEEQCENRAVLTVEAGAVGGAVMGDKDFGSTINAWSIFDECTQFDYYNGGGLDIAYLGAGQVDEKGNVNVCKFGNVICGVGGFMDIAQTTKLVIFCSSFTVGGLEVSAGAGRLEIVSEGKIPKFVKEVSLNCFNGYNALKNGQRVLYVTERAVFELVAEGVKLIEVAPGVDLEKDILGQMEFKPIIANDLKIMDKRIFSDNKMGLKEQWEKGNTGGNQNDNT